MVKSLDKQATNLQIKFDEKVKITAKGHIYMKHRDQCMDKLKRLAVQGKNLELVARSVAHKFDMIILFSPHEFRHTKMSTYYKH